MSILIRNIGLLCGLGDPSHPLRGEELARLNTLADAYLVVEGEEIAAYGPMNALPYTERDFGEVVDAGGGLLAPSWCDSHTHLVFAGSRESEFVLKIGGASYADIAAAGGGILSTAAAVAAASEEELLAEARRRLREIEKSGTGAVEIKSGYGLEADGERKLLRVIRRLRATERIPIRVTYLAAHALPRRFNGNSEAYVQEVIDQVLPAVAAEGGADYMDVFCESGFFTPAQAERLLAAGAGFGMAGKVHAHQLHLSGGVAAAVRSGGRSADHLECMDEESIRLLAGSSTIGTLLPGASFFLRMQPAPARALMEAGAALALASDYNPGSSPTGNMNLMWSLACIHLRLLPEEALQMGTINGAFAMDLQERCGSIAVGKWASLILFRPVPSLAYLPYAFGTDHIQRVLLRGAWVR